MVFFGRNLLWLWHNSFSFSDINNDIRSGKSEHHTVNNCSHTNFIVGRIASFSFLADFLEDDLFSGLCSNTTEAWRGNIIPVMHNFCFTGIRIQFSSIFLKLCTRMIFAVCRKNSILYGIEYDTDVDAPFGGDLVKSKSEF